MVCMVLTDNSLKLLVGSERQGGVRYDYKQRGMTMSANNDWTNPHLDPSL